MIPELHTPIALIGALPGVDLVELITWAGVLGVAMIIFAESGLLIGFFLPGDSLLFTAGFLTQQGILQINIHLFAFLLFVAATAGNSVGYAFGNRVGRRIFKRPDSLLFRKENLARAEAFYQKHGPATIVIACFLPVVRTFAPIVAGIAKMKYRTFLAYNIIGALLWAAGVTYIGYYTGAWFTHIGLGIDQVLLPIVAGIILLSITPPLVHILKNANRRQSILNSVKKRYRTYRQRPRT